MSPNGRTQTPRSRRRPLRAARSGARANWTAPIGAEHPDIRDTGHTHTPQGFQPVGELGFDRLGLGEARLGLEQVEAGIGGRAGERIGHEGRACISAAAGSSDQNASNTSVRAMVAASAIVPPVSAFDRHRSRETIPACAQAEQAAGAPEAGEDLVGDQRQAVAAARRARWPALRAGACACRPPPAPAARRSRPPGCVGGREGGVERFGLGGRPRQVAEDLSR